MVVQELYRLGERSSLESERESSVGMFFEMRDSSLSFAAESRPLPGFAESTRGRDIDVKRRPHEGSNINETQRRNLNCCAAYEATFLLSQSQWNSGQTHAGTSISSRNPSLRCHPFMSSCGLRKHRPHMLSQSRRHKYPKVLMQR